MGAGLLKYSFNGYAALSILMILPSAGSETVVWSIGQMWRNTWQATIHMWEYTVWSRCSVVRHSHKIWWGIDICFLIKDFCLFGISSNVTVV